MAVGTLRFVALTDLDGVEPRTSTAVRRAQSDLDEAFGAARPRLQRIATSLVGVALAEDVVHDVYVIARQSRSQLRDPLAAEAWLARICVHRCFRVNRRGRRLRELLDRLAPRDRLVVRPAGLELRELIDGLAPRERTVVILHHGYGYSLLEVAELVGISHANARKIASRARARLLHAWQEAER
jgi:RNA polymerase sigma factor (sigma-70 family)